MNIGESIVRLLGGAAVGAILGMIFVITPYQYRYAVHIGLGLLIVLSALSSLFGIKFTLRAAVILTFTLIFSVFLGGELVKFYVGEFWSVTGQLGGTVVNHTTLSTDMAMKVWGVIGAALSFYWGASGAWKEVLEDMTKTR